MLKCKIFPLNSYFLLFVFVSLFFSFCLVDNSFAASYDVDFTPCFVLDGEYLSIDDDSCYSANASYPPFTPARSELILSGSFLDFPDFGYGSNYYLSSYYPIICGSNVLFMLSSYNSFLSSSSQLDSFVYFPSFDLSNSSFIIRYYDSCQFGSSSPSGSISLSENGTYDVTNYAEAVVNVPPEIIQGDYHNDLVSINNSILVCAAVCLVIYFFYCIYRMIIKNTGVH